VRSRDIRVVVPDGGSSFVLESSSAANDRDAAEDIAAMIGSFDTP
jgi:hypothetical protein